MPTNWKYIKKQLEKEFLCEKLRGHITYDLTLYAPAPWDQQYFIMKHDEETLLEAKMRKCYFDNQYEDYIDYWYIGKPISDKIHLEKGIVRDSDEQDDIDALCYKIVGETMECVAHYRGFYGVEEIVDTIGVYLHSSIDDNLNSSDYFCRALAIFDRRCGKRRLVEAAKCDWLGNTPKWLKKFYRVRFDAEEIQYSNYWR